jgi:hypothetical protein
MRSATDWRRLLLGATEALVSALVVLLWTALVRDVDKASTPAMPECAAARTPEADAAAARGEHACNTAAAHGTPRPTSSGSGVVQGS